MGGRNQLASANDKVSVSIGVTGQPRFPKLVLSLMKTRRGQNWAVTAASPDVLVLSGPTGFGEPAFVARLGLVPLTRIVQFSREIRFSGVMAVSSGIESKHFLLDGGELKSAMTSSLEERLGALLVREGRVKKDVIDRVLAGKKTGRLGRALVDAGVLSENALFAVFKKQTEEIFLGAFLFREGHAALFPGAQPDAFPGLVSVDTAALVVEAEKRSREFAEISTIQSHGTAPPVLPPVTGAPQSRPSDAKAISSLIGTFNAIFCEVHAIVRAHSDIDSFHAAVRTFIQSLPDTFRPLFEGVFPLDTGALDVGALERNLHALTIEDPLSFVESGLNEILFFELFEARDRIPPELESTLMSRIRQIQALSRL